MRTLCLSWMLLLMGVAAMVVVASAAAASSETIELRRGESILVGDTDLLVEFNELIADERCPIGVVCFWEGDAVVRIGADDSTADPAEFELHTYRDFGYVAQYGEYRIALTDLSPYPVVDVEPNPDDYVVTLEVQWGAVPAPNLSWSTLKSRF